MVGSGGVLGLAGLLQAITRPVSGVFAHSMLPGGTAAVLDPARGLNQAISSGQRQGTDNQCLTAINRWLMINNHVFDKWETVFCMYV